MQKDIDSRSESGMTGEGLNEKLLCLYPLGSKTVSYTYDRFGNKETMTYPDGIETLTYTYDDLDRLEKIEDQVFDFTQYEYDDVNRLTKKTLPNGVYTDYIYDNANSGLGQIFPGCPRIRIGKIHFQ